ncbi:MAG: hypothetical protein SFW67_18620 [Myxococcaceae bacterium]|nr:hypothetical protein [Myxococcaceae bacterium]
MRWVALCLGLSACVTDEVAKGPVSTEVEGLVRRRDARCGAPAGFMLAVGSSPVAGRRLSFREGLVEGREVTSVVTSDEGAFRATLPKGRYCVVDVTDPTVTPTGCAGVLAYDPAVEPIPVVVLPPLPCR